MAIEKKFIKGNIKLAQVEEYLAQEFARAGYSHVDIARTPVATRVTVWAQKPGMVIGRGGKTIDALAETLKTQFGMENPALDVREVEIPDLDARIVAKQITAAIERGFNYKRAAQLTLQRVMNSGAVGVAIRIGGKVGGEMSRTEKFSAGYLKYAGEPAERLSKAYATAMVKLGTIGVQVRILTEMPKELLAAEKLRPAIVTSKPTEEKKEEAPKEEPKEEKTKGAPEEAPKKEAKEEKSEERVKEKKEGE